MGVVTHGLSRHRVYNIYYQMLERCCNYNHVHWNRYGGRGIRVCDRWYYSFEAFIKDMGMPPTQTHQIDRIDNDGNYTLENCQWVTPEENNNNKSNAHYLTYKDKTQSLTLWAKELNLKRSTLVSRIWRGWETARALSSPTRS